MTTEAMWLLPPECQPIAAVEAGHFYNRDGIELCPACLTDCETCTCEPALRERARALRGRLVTQMAALGWLSPGPLTTPLVAEPPAPQRGSSWWALVGALVVSSLLMSAALALGRGLWLVLMGHF